MTGHQHTHPLGSPQASGPRPPGRAHLSYTIPGPQGQQAAAPGSDATAGTADWPRHFRGLDHDRVIPAGQDGTSGWSCFGHIVNIREVNLQLPVWPAWRYSPETGHWPPARSTLWRTALERRTGPCVASVPAEETPAMNLASRLWRAPLAAVALLLS
jgi:hypothetical protein